jgi:hypothetical protein
MPGNGRPPDLILNLPGGVEMQAKAVDGLGPRTSARWFVPGVWRLAMTEEHVKYVPQTRMYCGVVWVELQWPRKIDGRVAWSVRKGLSARWVWQSDLSHKRWMLTEAELGVLTAPCINETHSIEYRLAMALKLARALWVDTEEALAATGLELLGDPEDGSPFGDQPGHAAVRIKELMPDRIIPDGLPDGWEAQVAEHETWEPRLDSLPSFCGPSMDPHVAEFRAYEQYLADHFRHTKPELKLVKM